MNPSWPEYNPHHAYKQIHQTYRTNVLMYCNNAMATMA
jgi:hypothetical protein